MKHSTTHDESHTEPLHTKSAHTESAHEVAHAAHRSSKKEMWDNCCTPAVSVAGSTGHKLIIGLVALTVLLNIVTIVTLQSVVNKANVFFDLNIWSENIENVRKIADSESHKSRLKESIDMAVKQLEAQSNGPQWNQAPQWPAGEQPKIQVQQGTGQ